MNPSSTINPFDVLLVEDSDADVLMTREALAHDKVLVNLHVVGDGVEALEFLRREGPYAAVPRPSSWTSTCPARTVGRCSPRSRGMRI